MYHVTTRKSDGAIMDCRPETVGIMDVLTTQIIVNYGGAAEDYEINTSETPAPVADLRTLEEAKSAKIAEIRALAAARLALTDRQVIRHLEQLAIGTATTLTEAEFATLGSDRQAIRDLSDTLDAEVNAKKKVETVEAVDLSALEK